MVQLGVVIAGGLFASDAAAVPADAPSRERLSFNSGWRFTKDDPIRLQSHIDYEAIRPWFLASSAAFRGPTSPRPARPPGDLGTDFKYVATHYDDSGWRALNLPHDWGIEGPFRQDLPGGTGKLPWVGVGWYRKKFTLPQADAGRRLVLEIDGAMSYAMVWMNEQFVGGWPYGYTSFQLDLTPYARPGQENVIAIRLDNPPDSSRWYPGSGLYRNVWLTKTDPVHIAQWGVFVTTPRVTRDAAVVSIEVVTENETGSAHKLTLSNEIYAVDGAGRKTGTPVAAGRDIEYEVLSRREASRTHEIAVARPRLWSTTTPHMYVAVTTVRRNGQVIDRVETPFGIRTFHFDAEKGFVLNGETLRLQGVCMHSDLGALGTAINTRAIERQLEILRSMGCNAIRTSHNPPAPEYLDACDRMGFLVINEAFDQWQKGKNRNDYHRLFADWHEADLRALIRRDRNHPSVIMWSLGNEVIEQWRGDGVMGWQLAAPLVGIARQEDPTRPTTGAFNNPECGFNGFQNVLDVFGYNYQIHSYMRFRTAFPARPLYGSETASALSSRGEYFFPVGREKTDAVARSNFQVSSYDLFSAEWATTPEEEWRAGDATPGYAGEFVWTGFDYLGEPTPYNDDATNLLNFSDPAEAEKMARQLADLGKIPVPSRSSYFGIVDLAGFPKDRFYLYQSRWRPDHPVAHLLPHWTWPGREGEVTPVHVYTSGDEAELFLNGQSLGRKKKAPGEFRLRWDEVKYAPGEIRVVAYKQGRQWAEDVRKTATAPAELSLTPDRASLQADGSDLAFITVSIRDAAGTIVPRADNSIRFTLQGPGNIVATDNGDPTSFESFQAPTRRAFNGLALVVVRTCAGQPGKLTLRAESDGLAPATCVLESR
ncbi:beta-galactosidase [Verrucomicrobia bacterium LW23]|nr:beta-galactosidase [Verrucomicrobia bacterium LW23]